MSSATGNAYLYTIIIIFIGAFCLLLVGSAAYSKAFKIKNSIIDMITENVENGTSETDGVDEYLAGIGYQAGKDCLKTKDIKARYFSDVNDNPDISLTKKGTYDYCVYKISYGNDNYYYKVITYMAIDLPLVNKLRFSISGDTRTFGGI